MNVNNIMIKRVYEEPSATDGDRILVDRLWPRGLSRERARVDSWMKALSPSTELRKWYGHDPARWPEFRKRYADELAVVANDVAKLVDRARNGKVTLLYSSRETERNNAVALKGYLSSI